MNVRDVVQQAPARLAERGDEARRWVKERVYKARTRGEAGLWRLRLQALERASELVDRASGVPVLEHVGPRAGELLSRMEQRTTAPPLADYDELNVRKVMQALRDLDGVGLLRVQHYEAAHKNRKTILDAIAREFERRERLAAV